MMQPDFTPTKVVLLGASGATGRLLAEQLLANRVEVVAIVRAKSSLPTELLSHNSLHVVEASINAMSHADLAPHVNQANAVLSCLGHNLTFKGMFGHPRRLVTQAIKSVVEVIEASAQEHKTKLVLMNTSGNANRDIPETPPFSQRLVVSMLRYLIPPHADNEQAADFLRLHVGQHHDSIEWVAVRPDALIDQSEVSDYDVYPSPIRNAIFDSGSTSRINVANFMSRLIIDPQLWQQWKGQMPVIYNRA